MVDFTFSSSLETEQSAQKRKPKVATSIKFQNAIEKIIQVYGQGNPMYLGTIVFGSTVEKIPKPTSDLDTIILMKSPFPECNVRGRNRRWRQKNYQEFLKNFLKRSGGYDFDKILFWEVKYAYSK